MKRKSKYGMKEQNRGFCLAGAEEKGSSLIITYLDSAR